MQQQYCRNFLSSFARSIICLALFAPACDYADDKIKDTHSNYHSLNRTAGKSSGYYYGLRARRSTDISGVHRNTGVNAYHDGLNRIQLQQDQRKKRSMPVNDNTDNNGGVRQAGSNSRVASMPDRKESRQYNRISGNGARQKQFRKNSDNAATRMKLSNTQGFVTQNRNPDIRRSSTANYSSTGDKRHYNGLRKINVPDKMQVGKNGQKKHQLRTHHDHYEHYNKYRKHKKHIVKRHPVSHVFITGYSFVPYSYYTYYNYYYPDLLAYSAPAYSDSSYISGLANNRESSGWVQLSNGQIRAAMDSFSREMEYYPNAGIPKVGYALAVAVAGDLTRAVLAMREALRNDPDSLQYIYLDEKLFDLVDDLIYKYEYYLQYNNRRPDEAFMVSVLYYLEQDYISAHDAIGRAISDGDRSLSVNNLHGIVNTKLQENYAGDYN